MVGSGAEPESVEARLRGAEDEAKELNLELEALRQLYADEQDAVAALTAELESQEGGRRAPADASVDELERQLATARTEAFRAANEAEDLRSELAAVCRRADCAQPTRSGRPTPSLTATPTPRPPLQPPTRCGRLPKRRRRVCARRSTS